jgi:hypothetical protein
MIKNVKQFSEGATAVVPKDCHQPSGSTGVGQVVSTDSFGRALKSSVTALVASDVDLLLV